MKQLFRIMMLTAALTLTWGCSSDNDDDKSQEPDVPTTNAIFTEAERPTWKVDWSWHDDVPDWQSPDPTLYESRMYVVIKLDVKYENYSTDDDRMAIFLGGECRGVGMRNVTRDGSIYFAIIVSGDDNNLEQRSEIRYYCASLKQIFVLPGFYAFLPDRTVGTDYDQEISFGTGSPKYSFNVVTLFLPDSLPFTPGIGDFVGAFVGDECRGSGFIGEQFEVCTYVGKEETVHFEYYSKEKGGIYTLPQTVTMNGAYCDELTLNF